MDKEGTDRKKEKKGRKKLSVQATDSCLLQTVRPGCGGHAVFSVQCEKLSGREVTHSPPSSDEVKNEWIYTSYSPYML